MIGKINRKVGIILLNWNGGEFKIPCIESIQKSTYKNFEIFVIDNNSSDDSPEKINHCFPSVFLTRLKQNLGFVGGNNLGMKQALNTGCNYLWILNNDTIVDSECLEILANKMESDKSVGIVTNKIFYADPPDLLWYAGGEHKMITGKTVHYGLNEKDEQKFNVEREIEFATGCSMLIRNSIIDIVGGFDKRFFIYAEDLDLSLRVRRQGYKIIYCPKAVLYHRVSATVIKNTKGKNSGTMTPFKHYLSVRNLILVTREYTNNSIYPFCLLMIFIRYVLYFSSGMIILRRWEKLKYLWKGLLDGMIYPRAKKEDYII